MGKQGAPPEGGYTPPGAAPKVDYSNKPFWMKNEQWDQQWAKQHQPSPYQQAAEAQASSNRPTQNTPFASSGWSQDANGNWTQNVGLNGPLAGANTGMQQQFADAWSHPLDNGQQARQHAEDAIYQRLSSRLDPMWNSREHDMQTQLANQGIDTGSSAYSKALDNFGHSRNDAYSSALMDAITGGGQEAQRQQQMDLMSRMGPMAGMQGLQGLTQMPGFQPGPNYLAAAMAHNQYGMDAAKMNNDMWGQMWSEILNGGAKVAAAAAGKP